MKRRHCESRHPMATHDFLTRLDKKHTVDIAVLDFSKAFDSIPHKRLLRKLCLYGIEGRNLAWISCFLHNRTKVLLLMGSVPTLVVLPQGIQLYQVYPKAHYWAIVVLIVYKRPAPCIWPRYGMSPICWWLSHLHCQSDQVAKWTSHIRAPIIRKPHYPDGFWREQIVSLYLYSHIYIRKFALPYPDINFRHQMINSFAKMSRKSGTPATIASLMFMFWFSELFINNLHNFGSIWYPIASVATCS